VNNECHITGILIDVAIPADVNIVSKKAGPMYVWRYRNLEQNSVRVIPSCLGSYMQIYFNF